MISIIPIFVIFNYLISIIPIIFIFNYFQLFSISLFFDSY